MAEPPTGTTPDAEAGTGPVVRDRRRLDPETGQVRADLSDNGGASGSASAGEQSPADAAPADAPQAESDDLIAARAVADERLGDLQRLQAEFVNYRRRVERERDLGREAVVGGILGAMPPVLED